MNLVFRLIIGFALVAAAGCGPITETVPTATLLPSTHTIAAPTAVAPSKVPSRATQTRQVTATPLKIATLAATALPAGVPDQTSLSPSECLSTGSSEMSNLLGVWFRWQDEDHLWLERLNFGEGQIVSRWIEGYDLTVGKVAPSVVDGSFAILDSGAIAISMPNESKKTGDFAVCGDLLAMGNTASVQEDILGYWRLPAWCWEQPDAQPGVCYPEK